MSPSNEEFPAILWPYKLEGIPGAAIGVLRVRNKSEKPGKRPRRRGSEEKEIERDASRSREEAHRNVLSSMIRVSIHRYLLSSRGKS